MLRRDARAAIPWPGVDCILEFGLIHKTIALVLREERNQVRAEYRNLPPNVESVLCGVKLFALRCLQFGKHVHRIRGFRQMPKNGVRIDNVAARKER